MAIGLIGKKVSCTQMFQEDGASIAVTVVKAGPCRVTDKRSVPKHGYHAVQLGFEPKKESRIKKPEKGLAAASGGIVHHRLKEFRVNDSSDYEVGQDLTVELFSPGDVVKVSGNSKGRGFQGVIKRHGHHGGPGSHGSMFNRAPGSIAVGSAYPSRVVKGRPLPGHMGDRRVTIKNMRVVQVRPEDHLLVLKGAVPGPPNGILLIEKVERKQ